MFMSPYIGPWPQKSSIPWQNLEAAYWPNQTTGSVLSCSGFSNFMFSILLYILRVRCSLCAIFHSLILIHECIFLNCYLITLFFPKNDSIFHSHVRILEFMKPQYGAIYRSESPDIVTLIYDRWRHSPLHVMSDKQPYMSPLAFCLGRGERHNGGHNWRAYIMTRIHGLIITYL